MRQRNLMIVAALAASLFVATACSSSSSSSSPAGGSTSTTSSSTSSGSPTDAVNVTGKSAFTITQNNFFFSPSTIDGSAGQKITFTVQNDGSSPHTFTIDNMNIDVTVQPGADTTVDVTFPTSGTVQFYCKFHKNMGMVGTLEVM
ncbi:MAG: cupredoxin domain-containing protein [Actinomycetota bacterium]